MDLSALSSRNRLTRRLSLLRGKRATAFDPSQRKLEVARRNRVGRKVRVHMRRLDPVLLHAPRWSHVARFLDDVAVDLGLGAPKMLARPLSLAPLQGRSVVESWTWLTHAIIEFCDLRLEGPVAQAVNRHGFRHVVAGLLRRSTRGERRALLIHGVEHLHVEAREDLLRTYEDHMDEAGDDRKVALLLAGTVEPTDLDLQRAVRLALPDFAEREAVEALAEYLSPADARRLEAAVRVVGGVPALVDRIGASAESDGRIAADPESVWRALGPLADEVRGAVAIVSAVDGLAERIEAVANNGPLPEDTTWDRMLIRAGLFSVEPGTPRKVSVRAPFFADLAAAR
jgi:hypothetical protein